MHINEYRFNNHLYLLLYYRLVFVNKQNSFVATRSINYAQWIVRKLQGRNNFFRWIPFRNITPYQIESIVLSTPTAVVKIENGKRVIREKIESYLFVCKNPFSKVEKIIWHTKQQGERWAAESATCVAVKGSERLRSLSPNQRPGIIADHDGARRRLSKLTSGKHETSTHGLHIGLAASRMSPDAAAWSCPHYLLI